MDGNKPSKLDFAGAAGPGAIEDSGVEPKPLLEGASEYEVITIVNPLSVDFIAQVASSRPIDAPIRIVNTPQTPTATRDESTIINNYGLNLRNPAHQGKTHIVNKIVIRAGSSINVLGNEAQVIVRQLVNEMMQREGQSLFMADKFARHSYEERVVISRSSVSDLLGGRPVTVQDQIREAVKESNEQEFPEITDTGRSGDIDFPSEVETRPPKRRGPGRPPKTATA